MRKALRTSSPVTNSGVRIRPWVDMCSPPLVATCRCGGGQVGPWVVRVDAINAALTESYPNGAFLRISG